MDFFIRCKVYPGQFSNEYAVSGVQADGSRFSLFAPETFVEPDERVTRDRSVDGWLKVGIWEQQGDRAVVKLPRESLEVGRYVTIRADQFRTWPQPAEVRP